MVPKYMFEIVDVAKIREKVAHCVDDSVSATSSLFSIFDSHAVIHHVLDISAVFRKLQALQLCVVIYVIHKFNNDSIRKVVCTPSGECFFLQTER